MSSPLILASQSAYKAALLGRLGLSFQQVDPALDETPRAGESPAALVRRLAEQKASAVASSSPAAVVIGADQIAVHGGRILGKPGTRARAADQLTSMSGAEVSFLTAVSVLGAGTVAHHLDVTRVQFRTLLPDEIERYIRAEQVLDCAGSFKSEGLGVSLFERIDNQDPSALIGLPLIWLCGALRAAGYRLP